MAKLQPNFGPQVMLDFGSGLGTALWCVETARKRNGKEYYRVLFCVRAAHEVWGQSLYQYQAIDSSQEMGELARALRTGVYLLLLSLG